MIDRCWSLLKLRLDTWGIIMPVSLPLCNECPLAGVGKRRSRGLG